QRELRKQVRFDALAGLVSRPQSVTERFDYVISSNRNVRCAFLDHSQDRRKNAPDRSNLATIAIARGRQCVIVPEQFVCAIDQVDVQWDTPNITLQDESRSINRQTEFPSLHKR